MHSALLIDVSAEAVARISQTWRNKKCQTMAHLIDALVGARNQCAGSAGSHMSVVEVTMCMLTGLRPRTVQQVVSQLRRRAWEPKAPGGQGGRPAKSHIEVCVPAGVPWDDEINGVCVDAHCPNIESSAPNLGESSVAQNQGRSITDIGICAWDAWSRAAIRQHDRYTAMCVCDGVCASCGCGRVVVWSCARVRVCACARVRVCAALCAYGRMVVWSYGRVVNVVLLLRSCL
jgi:hypothetical protein